MPIDPSVLANTLTITPMNISLAADLNFNGPASGTPVSGVKGLVAPLNIDESYILTGEISLLTYTLFVQPTTDIEKGYKVVDEDSHEYYVSDKPVTYKCPVTWEAHHKECTITLRPDS